jgi:hypothetical protein
MFARNFAAESTIILFYTNILTNNKLSVKLVYNRTQFWTPGVNKMVIINFGSRDRIYCTGDITKPLIPVYLQ